MGRTSGRAAFPSPKLPFAFASNLARVAPAGLTSDQVLAAAARLVANVMQQSSRAGFSVISRLADRIQQLAAAASSGGGHGSRDAAAAAAAAAAEQQLNACLHFAALLAATGGAPQLQPALLLCLPPLLPLARHGSSSTRRLMLDLCRALLPAAERLPRPSTRAHASGAKDAAVLPAAAAATSPAQAISSALLAAVVSRLGDRDATLRAKALACLEKHAPLAAAHLSSAGGSSDLVQALCSRWAAAVRAVCWRRLGQRLELLL